MAASTSFKVYRPGGARFGAAVTSRRVGATAIRILETVSGADSLTVAAREVADAMRDLVGFEAVWIRLRQGDDYPILTARDVPPEILENCNTLRRQAHDSLTCLCGAILDDKREKSDAPGFTARGGFWTNSLTDFASGGELAAATVGFRGHCVSKGFETLVSLPLRAAGETIGLIYLGDRRRDLIDAEVVGHLEELAHGLAVALASLQKDEKRQRAEEELRKLNLELESRVAKRTRELEETRDRLVASEKQTALARLLTGFAHEINTPLGISITASSLLEERVAAHRMSVHGDDAFLNLCAVSSSLISGNLRRVATLIETLKLLSPEQIGEPKREVALGEHLRVSTLEHVERLRAKGHTLDIQCADDLRVKLCPSNLAHVVEELLDNSLRHGLPEEGGGHVSLIAWAEGGELHLLYRDDGVGMDPDTLNRIFDPFFTTRRDLDGCGLGMHIVHNLVYQSMGGTIECSSAPGAGLTVHMAIPIDGKGA
ncbi:GAF domain-containing sensor histidine kinase [bacterium]|nr:GAF domain-containing sensor histidine kinase [bacterium]MBU1072874.1 GAF domain-containing sensor histidine kinase [bacterium]MBU1676980.1 GAF domain-containing sensor histidine kinase [bacterium]